MQYIPNRQDNKFSNVQNSNFTHIPKGIKEKLNLPLKSSTYLKKMINTKSQQENKQTNKSISKSNYDTNIFPVYNSNQNNLKRSFSINNSKKLLNEYSDNSNHYNYNNNHNFSQSGINYYTNNNNNIQKSGVNNHLSHNDLMANSFNLCNNNTSKKIKGRSKSNGKSKNSNSNPMMNLIRAYTGKSGRYENPATYRKYRAQTKSTDKLYQNIAKYPVHINPNDTADYNNMNYYSSESNNFSNNNYNKSVNNTTNPYAVNDVNVNLSKFNDYDYYHNLSLQKDINKNGNSKNIKINKNLNLVGNRDNSVSKMKKSFNVLSDILDSHFSVNTSNQLKFNTANPSADENMRNGDSKLNLSNYNNNYLNSPNFNYSGKLENNNNLNNSQNKIENISGQDFLKDKIYHPNEDQNTKLTINLSYLGEYPPDKYLEALEHIMTILDPIFERLDLNKKLEKFIENTDDHRRSIRLGSLVGIYILLKKYSIEDTFKITILEKIISLLHKYETQEELFLVACLEIASKYLIYQIKITFTLKIIFYPCKYSNK